MSNKHINHQHGLATMNALRPKSKMHKRNNKAKAKVRKAPLLAALREAIAARKPGKQATPAKGKAPKAAKTTTKKEPAPVKAAPKGAPAAA